MKISIEVEVEPNEFNLASELLRTLNLLTEHVKVRRSSSISGAAPSAAGPQAVSAPVPAAMPVAAPKATPPIPVPIPIVPSAAAAAPPGPPLPATPQDARRMFTEVLASVVDPRRLDAVAVELARLFESSSLSKQLLQDEFLEALFAVSFDQQHIAAEQSVAPFFYVLPKLPPAVKDTIKAKVIQKVLTHLNQKRPVTTRREEFYLQAEAFAVLSEMDFVSIDGAVQTIEKLLKNSEKRAAAITTLGKTVERSKDKVLAANPTLVGSLFSVLDNVTDQQFQYDIEWINNNMGRARSVVPAPASATPQTVSAAVPPPVAVPAAAAMPSIDRTKVKMQVTRTFQNAALGTAGTFFTLGWDPKDQHLISGGKEVPITVWASDGTVHKTIDCPGMYICCIDVEMQNQLILMCGIFDPPTDQYKSRIVVYDGRSNRNFAQMGEIKRAEVDMTAVVRALPGTANLITGESVRLPSGAFQEQISLYDLHHVVERHASITPTMTFNDHKNLVTCLAPLPTNPGVFVSGSRDNTVKVWDARSGPSALFTLGVPQGDFTATTHLEMVTCVDVAGDIVVSGSLDQSIAAWDLRTLGHTKPLAVAGQTSVCNQHGHQAQWTNSGILKACLDGSPIDKLAAVATVGGLYSVDFSTATPIITAANALSGDGTPKQYNDIRWATHAGRLYASSGEGATVDLLEIQQI